MVVELLRQHGYVPLGKNNFGGGGSFGVPASTLFVPTAVGYEGALARKKFCLAKTKEADAAARPDILARTAAVHRRHAELTSTLLGYGRRERGYGQPGGSALGSLLITWCVVVLEVAPAETVGAIAGELAVSGDALRGLAWGVELLSTSGFRHDDSPEELSSIARQLLFDLTAGMLCKQRFQGANAPAAAVHAVVPFMAGARVGLLPRQAGGGQRRVRS